ncbi:MAG TPA: sucrase ferredoxin, partial [Devosia sp.]|nr:sucrase ferredoxin [Devosia sp.]
MMARAFCTDIAITRGEPLAGTGALAERHLLVNWPKGKWRRPRFAADGFSEELQQAMRAASGGGRYVGLCDDATAAELQLLSFPDGRIVLPASQAEAARRITAWAAGTPLPGPAKTRPTILCCTDAKVDACCARYGFPVYKALLADADRYGFDILQCTHIGGCHFAPSIIVMPQRHRYGRLTPATIPALLDALAKDQLYLPAFKGRPEYDPAQQAVEIAALRWAEANGMGQPQLEIGPFQP